MLNKASSLSYRERASLSPHPLAKELFSIMERKQSNLALAADVSTSGELLELANETGPHLCLLKTHVDILEDFTPEMREKLVKTAEKHHFLIFEDRKFADIGNTSMHQYEGGPHRISSFAHLVNAYAITGPGVIEGLRRAGQEKRRGLLLVAELSSEGNLIDANFTQKTVELASRYPDFVLGFIAQRRVSFNPAHIHLTPGIRLSPSKDALGQRYCTPESALIDRDSDIIIVGRGIIECPNRGSAAETYRKAGWDAYINKMAVKTWN